MKQSRSKFLFGSLLLLLGPSGCIVPVARVGPPHVRIRGPRYHRPPCPPRPVITIGQLSPIDAPTELTVHGKTS